MANKAILAGASGLIGSALLEILLQQPDYDEVVVLIRNLLPVKHPKLNQVQINFNALNNYSSYVAGQALFCCLGSTRKKTPDLRDYTKVDFEYPLQLAEMALANGVEQYHLVSALGANKDAANFYLKMKGSTEEAIKRVGEKIFISLMKYINPLLRGPFKKYRSIAAKSVAEAMYKNSLKKQLGVFIYPSDKII